MFCVAISFIDVLENIFLHIQNPHDQTVLTKLTLTLHNYAEPSNRCSKQKKLFERILPASGTRELLTNSYCIFK
jgi:hypothetical protein